MATQKKKKTDKTQDHAIPILITRPNIHLVRIPIRGTSPYVQNAWSQKAREQLRKKQGEGAKAKNVKVREPKDFQAIYEAAKHISTEGWCGIPSSAFRAALISACRLTSMKMTQTKLTVFVVQDGWDAVDPSVGLTKITKGEPEYFEAMVRMQQTIDIRCRPLWRPGWEATVAIRWDADQYSVDDVHNLLMRVGSQVGIGEGRFDSKQSPGMGWGQFEISGMAEVIEEAA
jgi:hypothetical protein